MFITKEQKAVCEYRYAAGYKMAGKTISLTNGLAAFVMYKGRHALCINSLGYDEHYLGRTYNVEDVATTEYCRDMALSRLGANNERLR